MPNTAYEDLLRDVFVNGAKKGDRTGTGTRSVFGRQIRYDLSQGFPLITTKRVPFRLIAIELLWFLMGESNIKFLLENDVHIWSEWPYKKYLEAMRLPVPATDSPEWADGLRRFEQSILGDEEFGAEFGDLGPVYGVQWRKWLDAEGKPIDQVATVIEQIKKDPNSRRLIVSAWNVAQLPDMALAPCHAFFQFYVVDGKLSCQLYQRSADMLLGVPFNIASYALLVHMIAQQCDLEAGEFIWTGGDAHIYDNHVEQVEEQLSREPRPLPTLLFTGHRPDDIFGYTLKSFEIAGYTPHPAIKAPIAV